MNIKHKPGGAPEIKLDHYETSWLKKAAEVCSMLGRHLAPGDDLRPKLFEATQTINHAVGAYGRKPETVAAE